MAAGMPPKRRLATGPPVPRHTVIRRREAGSSSIRHERPVAPGNRPATRTLVVRPAAAMARSVGVTCDL
ncbi:hypothetical protein GUJ93_ZPchr0008g11698 [Zizania palustris]|uniref:Uncharacterized protein n=1 Tax=Zizania palustris TaxID=103762 RepID=A0A8J5VKB5_ZIZPA|nr:hypothetical protein GUJ93_ZPchr0008g11698 [Zizania palustris]